MSRLAVVIVNCLAVAHASRDELHSRDAIETSIAPAIQSSPKNMYGRLRLDVATRVVQRFLVRERAWHVKPSDEIVAKAVLEADRGGRGLSLANVVSAIESVERNVMQALPPARATASSQQRCAALKTKLVNASFKGTGRIALQAFHAEQDAVADSFAVLKAAGAIEQARDNQAHLLIANYLASSVHCLFSGVVQSECCPNECEDIMNALEVEVQAPIAAPDRLLQVVTKVISTRARSPRELPQQLHARLYAIADEHDGDVTLQSESFEKWLHYAFPNECPLPRNGENIEHGEQQDHVMMPYTTDTWLAEYAAGSADSVRTQAREPWTGQDFGRIACMALIGCAVLRTLVLYIRAATCTLQGRAVCDEIKKRKAQ